MQAALSSLGVSADGATHILKSDNKPDKTLDSKPSSNVVDKNASAAAGANADTAHATISSVDGVDSKVVVTSSSAGDGEGAVQVRVRCNAAISSHHVPPSHQHCHLLLNIPMGSL